MTFNEVIERGEVRFFEDDGTLVGRDGAKEAIDGVKRSIDDGEIEVRTPKTTRYQGAEGFTKRGVYRRIEVRGDC
jgi:hypothetical protein